MKRRNREVNIFNMSLLDILCGALGAFCFLLLSLLPYYRPPGKNININQEQKDLLDEVQNIKDLGERLKNTSTAEDQRELVKQLREMIMKLENEIKQLQGQVNALYAENEDLKKRVAQIEQENKQLLGRNQQLEQENKQLLPERKQLLARNQQLAQQNQQLQSEKQRLEQEKRNLESRIQARVPWTITMTAADTNQELDCSIHETVVQGMSGMSQPGFDPEKVIQPVFWNGDSVVPGAERGTVTRVVAQRIVGSAGKLYASLGNAPDKRSSTTVHGRVQGANMDTIFIPAAPLTPSRPWILVGMLKTVALDKITFIEATQTERDAEWDRLTRMQAPTDPALTDAVMGPGFEARKKEYDASGGESASIPVRITLLEKWRMKAQSDSERKYVATLIDGYTSLQKREPKPGLSKRQQAEEEYLRMEEVRRRAQQQQQGPQPQPQPQPQNK